MSIYERLNDELKVAMKEKNEKIKSYIRAIKAKVSEFCVAKKTDRSKNPSDNIMIRVITAYKKSLEKGIVQLEKGGEQGEDLISEYKAEILFCSKYIPNEEEQAAKILEIVDKVITDLNVSDPKRAGQVIGYIMKNNEGLDGSVVKQFVVGRLEKEKE